MSIARRLLLVVPALLLVASCGSGPAPEAKTIPSPAPMIGASHRGDIDVLEAVFVMNDDGSATLSARIVNHTDDAPQITGVTISDLDAFDEFPVRIFENPPNSPIQPGATVTTGGARDPVRVRIARGVAPGKDVPINLDFESDDYNYAGSTVSVSLKVPVIERTTAHDAVAGNDPVTEIRAVGAKIVVVPGQKRAFVGGSFTGSITDHAWELPTAVNSDGKAVKYRHQTATGGPYAIAVEAGKTIPFGGPPYVVSESEPPGGADYVDAKDVTVGETITVTIPFQSGDVIVPFKVVAG